MEATKLQYNGYNYLVIDVRHDCFYGHRVTKHVLTDNPKWCAHILREVCGWSKVDTKGQHLLRWERNPTIENSLKPYVEVKFVDSTLYQDRYDLTQAFDSVFKVDTDCYYEVVYVEPYDD